MPITLDIYVHLGDMVLNKGAQVLATDILTNCDLLVTQESEMVS